RCGNTSGVCWRIRHSRRRSRSTVIVPCCAAIPADTGCRSCSASAASSASGSCRMSRDRSHSLRIAFFGSSLVSAYWNGAATYYRGIIRALHERGHRVTFYEPDAFDRQQHRDMADPDWAKVVVYDPADDAAVEQALAEARRADIVVKASGVGVRDGDLEAAIAGM